MEHKKQHLLDEQLKEKLYDQEMAPPDFLWENIVKELSADKIPWWKNNLYQIFMTCILVTCSVAGVSFYLHHEKSKVLQTNNKNE